MEALQLRVGDVDLVQRVIFIRPCGSEKRLKTAGSEAPVPNTVLAAGPGTVWTLLSPIPARVNAPQTDGDPSSAIAYVQSTSMNANGLVTATEDYGVNGLEVPAPEPGTLAVMLLAIAGFAAHRCRERRRGER